MSCLVFNCEMCLVFNCEITCSAKFNRNHVNVILDSPRGENILVMEFLRCIATKNPGSHCKQEDVAFIPRRKLAFNAL